MDLAATEDVMLYDRLAKSAQSLAGNEHIGQVRDTSNRLKIKV